MLNISENESKLPNLDKYQNLESIGDIYFFYPLADFIMPFFHDILKLKPNHITTIGFLSRLFSSYMILYKKRINISLSFFLYSIFLLVKFIFFLLLLKILKTITISFFFFIEL